MRHIWRLRAWDSKYKAYVYLNLLKGVPQLIFIDPRSKEDAAGIGEWEMCTGLPDKSKNEIWQNDVLKQEIQTEYGSWIVSVGVMIFRNGGFTIEHTIDDNVAGKLGMVGHPVVIGSLTLNPKLLIKK